MNTHEQYEKGMWEFLRRTGFKGASPCTLRNYESTLKKFGAYLAQQDENRDLYDVVEQWRDEMLTAGLAKSTVKQHLITLNIFFTAASKRSFPAELRFSENPVDPDLYPISRSRPYDLLLDDSDIIKLWKNIPPKPQCKPTWERNYAIVCLILATGLRNAEVRDLRLSDVSWQDETITVRSGKGGKYRIVSAPQIVLESLEQYLNSGLRPAYLSDDDYLFGNTSAREYGTVQNSEGAEQWHPFSGAGLSQLIERHVQNVCDNPALQIRSHDLRHLYARIHLSTNGNLVELQAAMGHASNNTTLRYSGLVLANNARKSARETIAARDEAAEQLRIKNQHEQKTIPMFA